MSVIVRDAVDDDERAWANEWYVRVLFAPTAPRDIQLIAVLDGERVGLGRLVDLGDDGLELGGIFTDGHARNKGVASAVVKALLERAAPRPVTTWCVPFAGLSEWYLTFGMERVPSPAHWPTKVAAKVEDCRARGLWPVDVLRVRLARI